MLQTVSKCDLRLFKQHAFQEREITFYVKGKSFCSVLRRVMFRVRTRKYPQNGTGCDKLN